MLVDIEDHKGKFVRDTNSMAIINVDRSALSKHQSYQNAVKREQEIENRINIMQNEISSIKTTLDKVLELMNSNRGS